MNCFKTYFQCSLISTFGSELYDELVNYLATPQKLCTTLGLCSGANIQTIMHLQTSKSIIKISNTFPRLTKMVSIAYCSMKIVT